jgi:UDP-N-acetylglucosamine diphosphorylase/glucosamine-1-phosphate N-acetyltransferase
MNYILYDDPAIRVSLMPFTLTRPTAELRVGITTIVHKWEHCFSARPSYLTEPYLQDRYPLVEGDKNTYINGAVCPGETLLAAINKLKTGQKLVQEDTCIAIRTDDFHSTIEELTEAISKAKAVVFSEPVTIIRHGYNIFQRNGEQIRYDFNWLTKGRESVQITDKHTSVYNPQDVFVEEGAVIISAVLNANAGPIYIGKNAEVQEGSLVRGAFAICEGSILHMGSKMRGDNTIGPHCKVGGEITNSVFMGYSNKAHEGYLGNSVVGEWCNIGADTNTSNMKNDYGNIKLWSYTENKLVDSGLQFCGLMMGDHSKAGINTMFNTGSVVGVSANIFGGDFPPKYVPSFSWGGAKGLEVYLLDKALDVAGKAMQRRGRTLEEADKKILEHVFQLTHRPNKRIGFK